VLDVVFPDQLMHLEAYELVVVVHLLPNAANNMVCQELDVPFVFELMDDREFQRQEEYRAWHAHNQRVTYRVDNQLGDHQAFQVTRVPQQDSYQVANHPVNMLQDMILVDELLLDHEHPFGDDVRAGRD
jgi:hypothetical protein